ncbi:hypothetical protein A3C37_01915 [Candidatus Peribacteria bacterium RIFCSPHIGHO2_02_FULL_53_20]|nr:MAG: hypothetical protein A3C37_01915 [Candidatus Peribacteria bacterium RIFCSPHIGHO2_02_FULL_53_20]OGJ68080.1 MAG: hypothetical protein A3B61_01770 [Candidatus Peribacteria bacterium RIFCSPLOWO2_01_FULL_53_10]OGJ73242.1 MAG: hypothetical protein A3G69_05705 [Candidatus Peribacteria bacterium RIFCSPLOWO2_12_FULL_53_10]
MNPPEFPEIEDPESEALEQFEKKFPDFKERLFSKIDEMHYADCWFEEGVWIAKSSQNLDAKGRPARVQMYDLLEPTLIRISKLEGEAIIDVG